MNPLSCGRLTTRPLRQYVTGRKREKRGGGGSERERKRGGGEVGVEEREGEGRVGGWEVRRIREERKRERERERERERG